MSLINEVLKDLDQRGECHRDPVPAAYLRQLTSPRKDFSRAPVISVVLGAAAFACVGLAVFALPRLDTNSVAENEQLLTRVAGENAPAVAGRASVSAPPPERAAAPVAGAAVYLDRLEVEADEVGQTRLRFFLSGGTPQEILRSFGPMQLGLVLENTDFRGGLDPDALAGDLVRAVDFYKRGADLHVQIQLNASAQAYSQLIPVGENAQLILDLLPEGSVSRLPAAGAARTPDVASRRERAAEHALAGEALAGTRVHVDNRSERIGAGLVGTRLHHSGRDDAAPESPRIEKIERVPSESERADAAFEAALQWARRGGRAQAIAEVRRALEWLPSHENARLLLLRLLAESGRFDEVDELLAQYLEEDPARADYLKLKARILAEQGAYGEAAALLQGLDLRMSQDPDSFALLAATQQQLGNHAEAIRLYRRVLDFDPGRGHWWLGLGVSLEAEGRRSEALSAYREALRAGGLAAAPNRYLEARVRALENR